MLMQVTQHIFKPQHHGVVQFLPNSSNSFFRKSNFVIASLETMKFYNFSSIDYTSGLQFLNFIGRPSTMKISKSMFNRW